MRTNRELALAVRRALATGTIAICGAGAMAAYAQQAATPQPSTAQVSPTKSAKTHAAKANTAQAPILLAQATPPAPSSSNSSAPPTVLETVVVTGTLIARPASETAEAVTVVKADTLKNEGLVNVEQAVDQLTANVPSPINIAQSVGEFTGGGTYANLRDLGIGRTLVLLDGQRMANNVVLGNSVDLSGIPFSAIDQVQVVRDGASSEYGSDAIAGVINFITKKNYQGGEVNLDLDHPQQAGGGSGEADVTWGHGDLATDGYNFMVTGSYAQQNELTAGERSFAATGVNAALGLDNLNGTTGPWPGSYGDSNYGLPAPTGNSNIWQVGYPACAGNPHLSEAEGYCGYEYSAVVDLVPKSYQASAMASLTKELPANNSVQVQYFYTQSKVTTWGGPEEYAFAMDPSSPYYPTLGESSCSGGAANCTTAAPDLSDGVTAFWTDPNNNRYSDNINTEQRVLLTFSGDNAGWHYSTDFDYSVNKNTAGVTGGYPNEAVLAPGGVLSNLINPFGPQSAAGQALINSSYLNGVYANGKLQHFDVGGNANHALGDLLYADHPAVLAVGFSATYESIDFASTPLAETLYDALYYPPTAIAGNRKQGAIFSELNVPVSKSVEIDLADREDKYSDFGETNNGKVSLRYQPAHFLTFRATASTGFRAPTLVDLYSPNTFGATGGTMGQANPFCASGDYNSEFTHEVCTNQGMGLYGGNRDLQPETSQNFDFGVIVEPVTNLGITVDYYRILLKNALGTIPSAAIYGNPTEFSSEYVLNSSGSLTTAPDAPIACSPSYTVASCGYILQTTTNTGGITTDGFDLSAEYRYRTAIGTFHADLEGTMITHYRLQEYTGGPQLDLVGWFNSGNQPAIHWQHNLTLNWTDPRGVLGAGLVNHFLSSYIDEWPDAAGNQIKVGSQSTWDVYASYKPIAPVTVLFGIRNVFNQVPPFSNQTSNWPAGYNPIYSDPLLRTFYLNLKYDF